MAALGGCELTDRARRYTPLGTGEDYGHVRDAWEELEAERASRRGFDAYESGAVNPHYRATWLEYGTEPRVIEPDEAEAIDTPEGPRARARHPGTRGAHMLLRAMTELEVEFPALAQPELGAWAAAAERNAKRQPGVR
jgi:hypothetical protein